jgi:toxin ParE1/3/4
MARDVIWSLRARYDFFNLLETIAIDSQSQSDIVGERFLSRIALLPSRPSQGRKISEKFAKASYREVLVYQGRLIYEVKQNEIELLAIIHTSRDLRRFVKATRY